MRIAFRYSARAEKFPRNPNLTPHTLDVLRLLEDGQFHSGEALGAALNLTRATISNALHDVVESGLSLDRVHGRGYRLVTPVQWLSKQKILRHLGSRATHLSVEVVDQTVSTNSDLLERAAAGEASGAVIVAELQTGGRGRRGRTWHSGLGGALTFSLLWRFEQGAGLLSGLSLAVGIALTRVLHRHGATDVRLKWPNDILWNHMKLAGILIELSGDIMGPTAAVIGIGVNLRLADPVRSHVDQPATDLARNGVDIDRNRLFADLLLELDQVLRDFARDGFALFRQEWDRLHLYQDKMVKLRMPDNSEMEGSIEGVGDDGALLLRTESGTRKYYGGEISLRLAG